MNRSDLIICSGTTEGRFANLRARDQLPFDFDAIPRTPQRSFSLEHAFRLRLTLDLIGLTDPEKPYLAGVPANGAYRVISNALMEANALEHPHPLGKNNQEAPDLWLGVIAYETSADGAPDVPESYPISEWVANTLDKLHTEIAAKTLRHKKSWPGTLNPVRISIVNASRAARFVRDRARLMGIPEAFECSENWV